MRIIGRIRLPLIVIMTLSIITGIGLSALTIFLSNLMQDYATTSQCSPMMMLPIAGVFLIAMTSPITFVISYIAYCINKKNDRKQQPPVIS